MSFTWSDVTVTTTGGLDFRDFAEDTGHAVLCGVGGTGLVRTSADGSTWTAQTASEANNWRGIAYAPTLGTAGRLCAVASNGTHRVMTSDDGGVTWTNQTASEANQWQSIVWASWLSGGVFVAVASTGTHRCMTSPDGATWTNQTIASLKAWNGLAVSGTTLVAVTSSSGTQQAVTSTDAVTWTLQTTSASSAGQTGAASGSSVITYSSTLGMFAYVAVGGGARFINTSTDNGVTWVAAALPTSRTWTGIRWLDSVSLFAVVSQSSTTRVASSTDGVTFTEEDTGLSNRFWDCVGWLSSLKTIVSWGQSANTHMLVGVGAVPTITDVSPATGSHLGGTAVVISGTGFTGATAVTFCGTPAVSVTVSSDTSITCVTPPHAGGICDVAVVGKVTRTAGFTFVAVTRVSPTTGTVAGGTAVTVTGYGFAAASGVTFGGVAATNVVIVSNTTITCVTPAHASGSVDVTVGGVETGTGLYSYTLGVPQTLGKGPLLPPIPTRRHG